MQTLLLNCLLVLLFVAIGGLFAAAEMALVSLRPGQVRALQEGGQRGRAVARLLEDENNFLSAVQVGVTLAGFFSASFGAAQISPYLTSPLTGLGLSAPLAGSLAFVGVTVVVSYLSLVLGELVPKRLAIQSAQSVAMVLGPGLAVVAGLMRPVVWFLGVSTNAVLRALGRDPSARAETMQADELRSLVEENESLGVLERRITSELLSVQARRTAEVMTPRTEVEILDASMTITQATVAVASQGYSRYPVADGGSDDVLGYLHVRDLLAPPEELRTVRMLVRPLAVVPSSKPALEVFSLLRERAEHMALVVDEYGGTAGVVTLEDVMEEFVGEITDEFDRLEPTPLDGRIRVSGLLGRAEVRRELGVELPDGSFDTLGGYLVAELGRLAVIGDRAGLDGLELVVSSMDGRRIDRVDVTRQACLVDAGAQSDQA